MKGIWNHMRAIDLLQDLPQVDARRIGCIGHSLGGHNTLFLAAFDERVKAAVTNCGFTAFPKYYGGDLTGWSHKGYMPRIASEYGKDPKRVPFDFPEVLGAISPRPVLAIAPLRDGNFEVSGVRDCIESASKIYSLLGRMDALQAIYPDSAHEFPPAIRQHAYEWLDKQLKRRGL
jgi:pimeloyl-ACP methyl ester carboxylesterase